MDHGPFLARIGRRTFEERGWRRLSFGRSSVAQFTADRW